jgi:putative transposase
MRKSRSTDEQVIGFLKQAESGGAVKDLCRKNGFSDATFYKWRSPLGGLELEGENSKLKKLLADAMLNIETLKAVARGKR